jgi:hypothetical protein
MLLSAETYRAATQASNHMQIGVLPAPNQQRANGAIRTSS